MPDDDARAFLRTQKVAHVGTVYDRISNRTDTSFVRPTESNDSLRRKPLYILTSKTIFSAPEAFATSLQTIGRAVVVGERTAGGAHLTSGFRIDDHFSIRVPHARAIPDWEGIGVKPDVDAPAEQALRVAHLAALERLQRENPQAYPELVETRKQAIAELKRLLEKRD